MWSSVIENLENFETVWRWRFIWERRFTSLNVAHLFFFSPYFAFLSIGPPLIWVQNGVFGHDCLVQWLNAQNLEEESSGLNPSFGLVGHVTLHVLLELSVPQFLCS